MNALPDGRIDNRVYNLDLLADPSFEFQFPAGSGIRDAVVTRLRLTLRYAREQRLVLEANTQRNRKYEDWRDAYRKLRRQHPSSASHPDTWISQR